VPFAAGSFLYIALADIVPELHKESRTTQSLLQFVTLLAGVGILGSLLLLE
jgi:zinc and cadmium transporter